MSINRIAIEVNFLKTSGEIRSLQGVNCGPVPNSPSREQSATPLQEQYRQIGVDCVRTHDVWGAYDIDVIFPNMDADPSKESNYNFGSTDRQIEAIRSIGAEILYRLGYSWGGPNYVPSDYEKFAEICKHVVMHYNQGWANGFRYGIRYWEIWNEPDIDVFWKGTPEEYYRLYDKIARTLKTVDQNIRVGGPGLAGRRPFLEGFLQFCRANRSPLDFVSWHTYPRNRYPSAVAETARQIQNLLGKYGFDNVESFLTEWNFSSGQPYPDEFWNARGAAWTQCALIYLQDTPVSRAFRYRGNGGGVGGNWYGLFYSYGEFKKTAYAFLAMKRMLETPVRLACNGSDTSGFAAIAGRTESGNIVRVLVSNLNSTARALTLVLSNLPPWDQLSVQLHLIDEKNDLTLVEQHWTPKTKSLVITRKVAPSSVYLFSVTNQSVTEQVSSSFGQFEEKTGRLPAEMILAAVTVIVSIVIVAYRSKRKKR